MLTSITFSSEPNAKNAGRCVSICSYTTSAQMKKVKVLTPVPEVRPSKKKAKGGTRVAQYRE
ncbi:hypothetical protein GCM10011274_17390 [Paraglaciecola chathamensis]|uniref:Uncharacterized protein n=1 Tax=Paraglaciecola chathamensis TaxID=368405 RepID=A0A8H9LW42_9ALTE|nr:hypothetical protein GCM10011274_17390 [Paraglaciecola oceanifecundans]